jgi:arylsulfatase A-like enzyme
VTTIFTGLTPRAHGVVGRLDSLSPDALTLAEVLHAEGYATAAAVTNPNVAGRFGLRQGFETYDLLSRTRSEHVTEWAQAWWEGRRRDGDGRPFFLYLHTVDPHAPYVPEPAWRRLLAPHVPDGFVGSLWLLRRLKSGEEASTPERVRRLSALYDAEVAANDASFGDLLDALAARGLDADTLVVFVSDHGEEFHDHGGWEHAETLHAELLHVPLVIRLPAVDRRGGGRRVATPVQQADLMPTLLRLAGAPVPPGLEGRDLAPLLAPVAAAGETGEGDGAADGPADDAPLFSHVDRLGVSGGAVTAGPWRCIDMLSRRGAAGPSRELYRRPDDPGEHHDLAAERPVVSGWCRQLLRAHAAAAVSRALVPGVEEVDPELAEKLRALGYL